MADDAELIFKVKVDADAERVVVGAMHVQQA